MNYEKYTDYQSLVDHQAPRAVKMVHRLNWFSVAMALSLSIGAQSAFASASICDGTAGNLLTNCGFELGPVAQSSLGFTSQYVYESNLGPAGTFYIGNNPNANNGFFVTSTPNSGNYMMIVNGASAPNTTVWQETPITVSPNTTYYFSAFVQTISASGFGPPAVLDFSANGSQLGTTFTADTSTGIWQEFFASWASGSNTSVDLALVDQQTASGGNDFALDDLIFDTTKPGGTGVGGTGTGNGVPEPLTLSLFGAGLAGLGALRRRRKTA